jgi:Ca2+-binding EF-hand superfamily protein
MPVDKPARRRKLVSGAHNSSIGEDGIFGRNPAMRNIFAIVAIFALGLSLGLVAARASDSPETNPDELFKKLDANGDGVLTASEIPKEHLKFFQRLLRIGDTNKDGSLSREEFDAVMRKTEQPVTDISNTPGINAGSGPPRPQFDPKRVFQNLDKNKDGKLTRDEAQGRPRILALFDRLGKDELTLDDLQSLFPGGGKGGPKAQKKGALGAATSASEKMAESSEETPRGLPAFFRLLDTNHDGRLSREELSKAAELFDRLDRDHDGFLDAKELTQMPAVASSDEPSIKLARVRKGGGNLQRGNVTQLLKRADTDGDGKLSMEEAPPFLKKQFAKIDTNGDGFLDKAELEAWFRHRRVAGNTSGDANPSDSTKPADKGDGSGI